MATIESEKLVCRGVATAARWRGLLGATKDAAWLAGVKLTLDVDRGLFRVTVRYSATGRIKAVDAFRARMDDIRAQLGAPTETGTETED